MNANRMIAVLCCTAFLLVDSLSLRNALEDGEITFQNLNDDKFNDISDMETNTSPLADGAIDSSTVLFDRVLPEYSNLEKRAMFGNTALTGGRGFGKRAFSVQTARGFGKRAFGSQIARGFGKRAFATQNARGFGKRHSFDLSMARGFGKR